jgi:hypothetical protein
VTLFPSSAFTFSSLFPLAVTTGVMDAGDDVDVVD